MAVNLSPVGGVAAQFFDNDGNVLSGGKIYTYSAGSSTPAATYTTSAGNITHSNPIILDSAGRVPSGEIWLTDGVNYKFVVNNASNILIGTYDNISGINSNFLAFTNSQEIITATAGQTVFNLSINYQVGTNSLSIFVDGVNQYGPGAQYAYTETDSNTVTFVSGLHVGAEVKFTSTQQQGAGAVDASQVSYTPAGTGAVTTNVQAKLRQIVSVQDFGAVGDGTTDDTAAIQAALDTGGAILFPKGQYRITDSLVMDVDGTGIYGQATPYFGAVSEIKLVSATPKPVIITDGEGYTFRDMKISGPSTAAGNIGIQIGPTSGVADRDVYITNCFIDTVQDCVYSYGRGVYIEDSRLVATGNCLNLDWPNPFTQVGGDDDTAETGFRAIYFRNCRLQAIAGAIIRNVGANQQNMTGLTLTGNYCDGRNGVIFGSVRNATISANTIIGSNSIIFNLNYIDGLTITGNTFAGQYDSTGNNTTPHDADIQNIIYMNSGYTGGGITFTGNTVANLYKDGFFLNGTWSNVTIANNAFNDALRGNNNVSLAPAQYGIVKTNTNGSGLVFMGNVCDVGNWTRNAFLVNGSGSVVTNWTITGNTFNASNIGEQNLGSYTPSFLNVAVPTYGARYAKYTRIGDMWFIEFSIQVITGLDNADPSGISVDMPFNSGATVVGGMAQINFLDSTLLTAGTRPVIVGCKVINQELLFTDAQGVALSYTNCNQSGYFIGFVTLRWSGS
jgi:hypothetical protein